MKGFSIRHFHLQSIDRSRSKSFLENVSRKIIQLNPVLEESLTWQRFCGQTVVQLLSATRPMNKHESHVTRRSTLQRREKATADMEVGS